MRPLEDPPMDMSKKTTGLSAADIAFAFGVCGGGGSLALGGLMWTVMDVLGLRLTLMVVDGWILVC
jgi:hypothetical protein